MYNFKKIVLFFILTISFYINISAEEILPTNKMIEMRDAKTQNEFIKNIKKDEINKINNNGDTLLMSAAYLQKLDIVIYLIENGAKVDIVNKQGKSALWFALFNIDLKKDNYLEIDNLINELEEYKKETKIETVLSFLVVNSIKENKDLLNSYMETGTKYIRNDIIKEIIKNDVSKDINFKAIIQYLLLNDIELFEIVLRNLNDKNIKPVVEVLELYEEVIGDSLIFALKKGNLKIVQYIYEKNKLSLDDEKYREIIFDFMIKKIMYIKNLTK